MAEKNEMAKWIQYGLFMVAGTSIACAILHAIYPDRFDEKTAMFLIVALTALVIHQVTKFKGFGIEVEKEVKQLKEDVRSVESAFGSLEKGVGPGSRSAPAPIVAAPAVFAAETREALTVDPEDPNKGQFGGLPEANGRILRATIKPDSGPWSSRCRVNIKISSTDPARPLAGTVKLYLHPTFGRWAAYEIAAKGGAAENEFVSYGAFTIGVEADGGTTRLELNLVDVPGGTERFYEE